MNNDGLKSEWLQAGFAKDDFSLKTLQFCSNVFVCVFKDKVYK